MKDAVIDISSTRISLVAFKNNSTEPAYTTHEAISLDSYLDGNCINARGIEKTIYTLCNMRALCKSKKMQYIHLVSTSALRDIDNAQQVFDAIKQSTGMNVVQLDGHTEALCGYTANSDIQLEGNSLLVDIGGASIELCNMASGDSATAMPFGFITMQKEFVSNAFATKKEKKKVASFVKEELRDCRLFECGYDNSIVVGATNMSIYDMYVDYHKIKEPDYTMQYPLLKQLLDHLMTSDKRTVLVLKHAPEKIYFITTALICLLSVLRHNKLANIVVSSRGVKVGYYILNQHNTDNALDLKAPVVPTAKVESVEEMTQIIRQKSKSGKKKTTGA